ncbi:MAG: penicillin acylase family protein [Pseudomonadota bacterium]
MNRIVILALLLPLAGCLSSTRPAATAESSVRIVRDGYGVPHVYADTRFGLYYGYGYAVAEDRLAQMEMARRSTQGTVAEVLGPDFVDYDRNTRRLFSPASIRRQLAALSDAERAVFEGYAAGFNRRLTEVRDNPAELRPQQLIEWGIEPQDWTAYDVAMIFIGTMNNRYGDFNTERENAAILAELTRLHGEDDGLALFNLLNPRFTDGAPTTIPVEDWNRPGQDALASAEAVASAASRPPRLATLEPPPSGFSNVYLLGKSRTEGANAVIVNGPQFGWFNPAYVYSVGLHGDGIHVVGNTPFGYPMVMFGHNERITWGSTWGASDIVDLFVLTVNPEDAGQYRYQDQWVDFEQRTETIAVKGAAPTTFVALRSVHGPVIELDAEAGRVFAKKRAWDGIELDTLLAWLRATWAQDWASWKAEAEKSAINVNMYFADVDGNIGYFHGGHFPIRAPGHDNRLPVSGDGAMDWRGRQPPDQANPHVLNPSTGYLANWNNKPGQGVLNPDFFFYSWTEADRVDYLHDALAAQPQMTPDEAWDLLPGSSYADLYLPYLLPLIERAASGSTNPAVEAAFQQLADWSGQSRDADKDGYYDEPATGLFRRFVAALAEQVLKDDLGTAYGFFAATGYPTETQPTGAGTNLQTGLKAVLESAAGRGGYDLFNGAPVEQEIREALKAALEQGGAAPLATASRPFGVRNFLGVPQALVGEGLRTAIEQNRGTENNMIVMKPGAIEGWEVTPPGQSGFIAPDGTRSPHYSDQLELYQTFGRRRTWFYPADVQREARTEKTLTY